MKKILIILVIIAALIGLALFMTPQFIEKRTVSTLTQLGFSNVEIAKSAPSLDNAKPAFHLHDVSFDGGTIDKITLSALPTAIIGASAIDEMQIHGFKATTQTAYSYALIRRLSKLYQGFQVSKASGDIGSFLPAKRIVFDDAVITYKDLQFTLNANARQDDDNNIRLGGTLESSADDLSFKAGFKAILDQTGTLSVDADVSDMNAAHSAAQITRGAGWLHGAITEDAESKTPRLSFSGQIDAGSGAVFGVPLKNVSLLVGTQGDQHTLITRAQAAGYDGAQLLIDGAYGGNSSAIDFSSKLIMDDVGAFMDHIKTIKPTLSPRLSGANNLSGLTQSEVRIDYKPERRFAGGPFPFTIQAMSASAYDVLDGTFLIYPSDLTIRGNAQTGAAYTDDFQVLFNIAPDKVSGTSIRLDGSLENAF